MVAYDLCEGEDHEPFISQMKSYFQWWHYLEGTWLIRSELTHRQIRDELRPLLHTNDRILVIDVTRRPGAWTGFSDRAGGWIKENL